MATGAIQPIHTPEPKPEAVDTIFAMLPKDGTRVVERVSRPSTPLHARDEFGDGVQMKVEEVWRRPSRINPCNR